MNRDGAESGRRLRVVAWLAIVLLIGLGLRLAYLVEISRDVLYKYPVLDEEIYTQGAADLAAGHGIRLPYWRPPGLYFALALIFKTLGTGQLAPRFIQILLSTASCGLVFALGRRFFSPGVALAGAALMALNGIVIASAVELKDTTWILFFDLVALLLLAGEARGRGPWRALAAGLFLGMSALFRPVILAFLPFALAGVFIPADARRRWALAGLVVLGTALPVLPVAWQNNRGGGPFVLISTNGGMNFFIGNNPDYARTVTARPGNQWDAFVIEPARRAGFEREGPEREQWYFRKGVEFLRQRPLQAGALGLRKLYLFFNGHEIPRDTDIYLEAEESRILRPLAWNRWPLLPMGVLIPLAIVGVVTSWTRRRDIFLLTSFLLVQAVAVAAFFVSSRYRVPSIPALSILAAVGAVWMAGRFRPAGRRQAAVRLAALLGLAVALNLPTFETRQSLRAERLYFRANALDREGRYPEALDLYRQSARLDPTDVRPLQGLGNRLADSGDLTGAVQAWRRINAIGPYSARDRDRLVSLLVQQQRWEEAIQALREDIAVTADLPARRGVNSFRLGVLCYEQSRLDESIQAFKDAYDLDPGMWTKSVIRWSQAAMKDGQAAAPGASARGNYWLEVARLAGRGGDPRESLPIWHHAADLLADDSARRAEIARFLEGVGDVEGARRVGGAETDSRRR